MPFPSPGDLPNPGIEHRSPALQADPLPAELSGKPILKGKSLINNEIYNFILLKYSWFTMLCSFLVYNKLIQWCTHILFYTLLGYELLQDFSKFIYLFIYFTLQYCIGFAIHWLESSMSVHVFPILSPHPPPSPSHPSGSSQCTSIVLCAYSRTLLFFYSKLNSFHLVIPRLQFNTPLPTPPWKP